MGHPVDNVCVQKEPFVSSRNSMEAPRVGARPPPPPRPLQRPNRRRRSHHQRTSRTVWNTNFHIDSFLSAESILTLKNRESIHFGIPSQRLHEKESIHDTWIVMSVFFTVICIVIQDLQFWRIDPTLVFFYHQQDGKPSKLTRGRELVKHVLHHSQRW